MSSDIFALTQSEEESDSEPTIKSQVLKSVKKRKSKENKKGETVKRSFSSRNNKRKTVIDNLIVDDDNFYTRNKSQSYSSKLQFLDSEVDKLLVNINCDLEEKVKTFNQSNSSSSKLLINENILVSDVMKWKGNSSEQEDGESYYSNFIKKKLSENAFKKIVNKSPASGWSQYKLPKAGHDNRTFHGLPSRVQQLYEEHKGIKQLFSWQQDCLNLDAVKKKKNLIYSLPTSGGKSLVAEILILKEILIHHKNVLFILPYVSIVQEIIQDFSPFALEFNFSLEEYAAGKGIIPVRKHRKKNSLIIATIEKGLIVVNSLIEVNRLGELGLIVVDELHLLSEEGRGPILETFLIQIMNFQGKIQLIAMTATIGNLEEVAKFLKADSYSENFRPVHLSEYIKCGNKIYSVNSGCEDSFKETRTVDSHFEESLDGITHLVQEIIPKDAVLIFCPTKKNCENVATSLCQHLTRGLTKHKEAEKTGLLKALITEMNDKICPILKQTVPFGVAYHHSGLTVGERRLLEEAFRQGSVSVLCCTSTLAVGVNLPAKRVILRSPYIGKDFITLSKYKQMVGRAGRTGFGSSGDSFLICLPADLEKVGKLFRSQMDEIISKMDSETCKDLILSSICLGIATTRNTLKELLERSLLHNQFSKLKVDTGNTVDDCLRSLYTQGALMIVNKTNSLGEETSDLELNSINEEKVVKISSNCELRTSRLGRAAVKGGLNLKAAHELYGELVRAQRSLVLLSNLHLLYLVTPFELLAQIKPDFQIFFSVYMQLNERDVHAARVIGITEGVASKLAVGTKPKLPRGLIQSVMTSSATFANSVLRFCEELEEFWPFKSLLGEFAPRLAHCCAPELLPLMDLPAVKKGRAKQLHDAGFKTLQIIALAQPVDLVRALDHLPRNVACQIIAAAQLLLKEKAEYLREEADIVLEGLAEKFAPMAI